MHVKVVNAGALQARWHGTSSLLLTLPTPTKQSDTSVVANSHSRWWQLTLGALVDHGDTKFLLGILH